MVPYGELFARANLGNDGARDQPLLKNPPASPWRTNEILLRNLFQLASRHIRPNGLV